MKSKFYELLCNSDIVNSVLKTNGSGGAENLILLFIWGGGCFNCWWVRCGGVGQKVLFGTG